jgi:hypothetical protein
MSLLQVLALVLENTAYVLAWMVAGVALWLTGLLVARGLRATRRVLDRRADARIERDVSAALRQALTDPASTDDIHELTEAEAAELLRQAERNRRPFGMAIYPRRLDGEL